MRQYRVSDVQRLLHLSRGTIRTLVDAGFVSPARGPRNALVFSFQDLVVLRTARALTEARVPRRRILTALKELRRHLPASMPLSGLSISAVANRVVVNEGGSRWHPDSGQYLLAFEGDPASGSLRVIEPAAPMQTASAAEHFERAIAVEPEDRGEALRAYEQAVAIDPGFVDAWINLGSLLHESSRFTEAEQVYRRALESSGAHGLLLYNLGVLLEDMNRPTEAFEAYERALECAPEMADCHYNLALLCESIGKSREAIRHMAKYRRLTSSHAE
ncbi:MAG TPA: tetratricopeptide repeat protein [Burkholderiales bacterium]|nr:tetratricopeptide repeat protein [Burkholderiales bacterium]